MTQNTIEAAVYSGRVAELLAECDRAHTPGEKRSARDGLRRAVRLADPGSIPREVVERLEAASVHAEDIAALAAEVPPQAVHVPFVNLRDGSGFCRTLLVTDDPRGARAERAGFDAAARVAIDDGLRHALGALGLAAAPGYTFLPLKSEALDGARVQGDSLGAAVYVSARARFSRGTVRTGTVVTGSILHGRVTSVGGMDAKVRALRDRPDLLRMVVRAEDHGVARSIAAELGLTQEILAARTFDDLARLCLEPEPRPLDDPEREVNALKDAVDRGWQEWMWSVLRERIDRLVDELPRDALELRVRALTMLGAVLRNGGEPDDSATVLEEAEQLLERPGARWRVSDRWRSYLHRHRAMTAMQLGRLDEAGGAARRAMEAAERARSQGSYSVALGVLGLVELARGDAGAAVRCQRESIEHIDASEPERMPRPMSYLVQALGVAGDLEGARQTHRDARARLHQLGPSPRTLNESAWVGTAMLSALVRGGAHAEALALGEDEDLRRALAQFPMPGLLIRRWLGTAEVRAGDRARGYRLLGDSPHAYRGVLGAHNAFVAAQNVLHEHALRVELGDLDEDAAARLESALGGLGYREGILRVLAPAIGEVLVALRGGAPGLGESLGRLIDACDRFG